MYRDLLVETGSKSHWVSLGVDGFVILGLISRTCDVGIWTLLV